MKSGEIGDYCLKNNIRFKTYYTDVFEYLKSHNVANANIIVISYLISYLCNTDQIYEINNLAKWVAERVIDKKRTPLLLVINDVNSYKRGRNAFGLFESAIRRCGMTITKSEYKYFDSGNLYDGQRLGTPYSTNSVAFGVPREIQAKYHAGTSIKSTVQLLVEVS